MDINDRPGCPSVSLVDRIAVPIDLQGAIEVSSRLDRALAIVFDFSAPENRLSLFVGRLQFQPNVKCVDRSAWKEVPGLAGAHHDVYARVIASPHRGLCAIDRCSDRSDFSSSTLGQRNIRLFASSE